MASKDFLAVDLGAESGRTVLCRFDGERMDLEETHRFANGGVQVLDTLYWDVLGLWRDVKVGIAKTVQQNGPPAAVGIDTWGVDYGLIDAAGAPISNPVHHRDARTENMMERVFEKVPAEEIYELTGLQFMRFNTLFQLYAAAEQSRTANVEPFAGADKMLMIPDLLNFFLTGVRGAEYTIASTSQILNARTRQWETGLLDRLGIPSRILPDVISTGSELGAVLPSVVEDTGALGSKVIATAGHDTGAAVAAVPAQGDGWCYISSGTWSLMGAELPEPAITAETRAYNFTNEGGVSGTIRYLKNIMGLWLVQQCRKSLVQSGKELDYASLVQLAEQAPAFGPIIDPDQDSFINPPDMPQAIRAYCALTDQHAPDDEGSLVRCCLESLALRYRQVKEAITATTKQAIDTIHIVGGGSKNELLCQMTADCCQCRVVTGPVEATAMGNALVQAMGLGELGSLADAREVVRRSGATREYNPASVAAWEDHYGKFLQMTGK